MTTEKRNGGSGCGCFILIILLTLFLQGFLASAQNIRSGDVPIANPGEVTAPYRNFYVADRFGWNDDWGFSSASWSMSSEADMARLRTVGHSWVRYWIWWSQLETSEGQIDWTPVDDFFAKARKLNLKVYLTIFTAPAWATGGEPWAVWNHCLALPSGSRKYDFRDDLPECASPTKPIDKTAFRNFVRKVLERYPEVEHIGFWNEPSLLAAWPWAYKNSGGENWVGRPECYRELAEQVYLPGYAEAKLVRPAIKVVGPDEYQDVLFPTLLELEREYVERGFGKFFDIVSVHLYGSTATFPKDAFFIFDKVFLPAIQNSVEPREIWVTESGFSWNANLSGSEKQGEELQAERLVELYEGIWNRREYVSKFFLYRHNEGSRPWHPEELPGFGIFRGIDGSARPAYFSIKDFMFKIGGGFVGTTTIPPR